MTSLSDAFEQASDAVFALLAQVRQKPTESRLEFSEIQANRLGDSFLVDLYLRSLVIPVWHSFACQYCKGIQQLHPTQSGYTLQGSKVE